MKYKLATAVLAVMAMVVATLTATTVTTTGPAYAAAASQDKASAVSSSWGDSETFIGFNTAARKESAKYAQAFNEIFLELAIGAAYTPLSLGPDGKIYSLNAGHLFVVGDRD